MTQLKANYIVFAAIVGCITAHSWRQLNNSSKAIKTTVVETQAPKTLQAKK